MVPNAWVKTLQTKDNKHIAMKHNLLKSGLFAALLTLTLGCQKDTQTPPDLLTGRWEWIRTIRPYTGQESNPQTTGFSQSLVFSENSKMQEYKNGVVVNTSKYSVVLDPTNPKNHELTNNTILNSHFYIENDTLIFSEAYVDGDVNYYVRLP